MVHFTLIISLHSWFSNSATSVSTKTLCSSCEFLLKTVISTLGNGQEYIAEKCVCRFHAFQDDHAVTGGEELQSLRWNRPLTTSLSASSANYFLISWQKPSRFFATTVEYFLKYFKIFHSVNFQRNRSLAGKTFTVYWKPRKSSHRETFVIYSIWIVTWSDKISLIACQNLTNFYVLEAK